MAWIEIHQSLPGHRKTLKAAARLHIDPAQMVGHMVTLWLWGLDNAPDGCIGGEPWMIAHAAGWRGDPEAFVNALHESAFVGADGDPGNELWSIANWHEYAGKLIDRRAANVQRMRAARATNGARTVHERVEPPYSTVQNSTEQNQVEPKPKPLAKRVTTITDEFVEKMVAHYGESARSHIDAALGHKNYEKWNDRQMYLKNWLRRAYDGGTNGTVTRNNRTVDPGANGAWTALLDRGANSEAGS
jgi:hypothetical protein